MASDVELDNGTETHVTLARRHPLVLTLFACALYGGALMVPTMRWGASEKHPTAGSARVFGDGFALVDGGFGGTSLLPLSVVAVALVAMAALTLGGGKLAWWTRVGLVAVSLYCPIWVAHVFARKLEDRVWPAEGALLLALAATLMLLALWSWRPKP
jgi:hypothetical protein